jgi:hypothetical protein
LDDLRLTKLIGEQLSWTERMFVQFHLAICSRCCARKKALETHYATKGEARYKRLFDGTFGTPPAGADEKFLERLDRCIAQNTQQRESDGAFSSAPLLGRISMNPALATAIVCSLIAVVSFGVWLHQRTPGITSAQFLMNASRWEQSSTYGENTVVFQRVRIKTPHATLQRAIYRDPSGRRRPRQVALAADEQQLRNKLAGAGVNWDDPLSASGYQRWREFQQTIKDDVRRTGEHALTLRTTAQTGPVAEESLTVTDTDFRPIIRTVEFRDQERVEIAELEYKALPWDRVDQSAFEPLGGLDRASGLPVPSNVIPFPRELTEGQLDEAELGARMVLNRAHADVGEQIELHRSPRGIDVTGYVESDKRKQELAAQLDMLPNVTSSIRSASDANAASGDTSGVAPSIKTAEMLGQVSSLATYLYARGYNATAINNLSQRLFEAALHISQESNALAELDARFTNGESRTLVATATLSELRYSHRERLDTAIEQESKLLAEIGGSGPSHMTSQMPAGHLASLADRHLALCKEMTATDYTAPPRKAETILLDLRDALRGLRAEETHRQTPGAVARDGRN